MPQTECICILHILENILIEVFKGLMNQASFKLQHFTGLTFIDNTHGQYNHYHYIFKHLILNNFILNQLKVNNTTYLQLGQVRLRYLVTEMEKARTESFVMKQTVAQDGIFFFSIFLTCVLFCSTHFTEEKG